MAELVLGLAKSAVKETANLAKSATEEEKKLRKNVQRDLMLISDEFEMMHSFLNVAKDRVADDDMARTAVRQVRDMALDVEDCVESILHLDNKSSWWRRMLPSWIPAAAPAVALDDAVAAMEQLKARVEALGQRNLRYSRIGDANSAVANSNNKSAQGAPASNALLRRSATAPLNPVSLINQREWIIARGNLVSLINHRERIIASGVLQVISVLGTLGAMSIVKRAYDDPKTCDSFCCRAWVKLVHPFNPLDFIRVLVAQFCRSGNSSSQDEESSVAGSSVVEMTTVATQGVLIQEFMELVSHHKYLVVLQGVTSMEDWETVRVYLPDKHNGSCIIVNTHEFEVASLCVGQPHRGLELEKLSDHHSVYALVKEDDMIGHVETAIDELYPLLRPQIYFCGIFSVTMRRDGGVHSVWGMSGVGKSLIVKHIFVNNYCGHYGVKRDSFTCGWVTVSRPFNLTDLSCSLLLALKNDHGFLQDYQMSTMKDPIEECRQYLYLKGCFIVIDNLQTREEWDLIKGAWGLETTTTRHVIFVITNEESVAKYCATNIELVYNVKGLGADHTLQLLKTVSPSGKYDTLAEEELHVLHKFGGLPGVICTVAMRYSGLSWDVIREKNLVSLLEADAGLDDMFSWLHAYFRSCPDFLKPCIFYLSIFPLSHIIRRRRLVRRWIAEGYSRETKEYTAEENGEMYFSTLNNLSMIQASGTTSLAIQEDNSKMIPLCQANGFLREYIISRSMEENLVFALDGHCHRNLQRTGRHLAIDRSWDRDQNVFESIEFSRLRSLTVFGEWKPFFISEKMKLLRVLDLENTSPGETDGEHASPGVTDGDIRHIVKLLPRLKFLSLRRCRQVTHLPDSIGDRLKQLQTLDIRETSVKKLPKSIINLDKLQYIRAGKATRHHHQATETEAAEENPAQSSVAVPMKMKRPSCATLASSCLSKSSRHRRHGDSYYHRGIKVPRGIWKLFDLHTLGVVDVGATGGGDTILEELKKLTQLHKLGVCSINRNNFRRFFSAISGLAHLESLSVGLQLDEDDKDEAGWLDDISSLPVKLRSLKLYGLACKIPEWTKELKELRKLSLQMIMLPQEGIDGLPRKLRKIRLFLSEFHDGELHFGRQGHLFLDLLDISFSPRVQAKVTFHNTIVLQVLRIRCCSMSSLQFSGLRILPNLEEVWISSPYNDDLKQHLEHELGCRSIEDVTNAVLRLDKPGSWIPWLLTSS